MEITNIILLSIKYTIPNELFNTISLLSIKYTIPNEHFNTISLMFTQKLGQWCKKRMSGN